MHCSINCCHRFSGQAVVEGAFLIPIILLLLLLLIQPAILLYDRMVMQSGAAEGCRVLATKPAAADAMSYEEFVRRRLGAIPQQDNFHVHSQGCSWDIDLIGDESSMKTQVVIETEVRPLPLFDWGGRALGIVNGSGNFVLCVDVSLPTYADWVANNDQGIDPQGWTMREGR